MRGDFPESFFTPSPLSFSIGGELVRLRRLNFEEVKRKIGEHLKNYFGVEEFEIAFAKQEEDVWRVNVEYRERDGAIELPTAAQLSIDARTGEVVEFRKGYSWGF